MGTSYLGRACAGSPAALNVDDVDFFAFVRDLIAASRLAEEARFVQHGSTSTLLHSLAVAYKAGEIVCSRGRSHLLPEAWRAALLHDYYLYDWHDSAQAGRLHGFTHPGIALKNAYEDFPDLTWREADAIARHMFPLTPVPPCSAVGWAVVAADKVCACYETSVRGGEAYPVPWTPARRRLRKPFWAPSAHRACRGGWRIGARGCRRESRGGRGGRVPGGLPRLVVLCL